MRSGGTKRALRKPESSSIRFWLVPRTSNSIEEVPQLASQPRNPGPNPPCFERRAPPKDQEGALSCAKAQIRARRSRQIPSRRRTPLAARARCRRAHMLLLLAPMSAVAAMSWVLIGELDDLVVGCNHYTASKPRSGGVGEFATLALALLPLLPPTGNPAASVLKHARH